MMTTMAAPAYTTMAAAPAYTYAEQPTYTYASAAPAYETVASAAPVYQYETMAAPAVTYAAAPVVETVAAPQVTYAAAPMTQVASYVAPPTAFQTAGIQVPSAPVPPQKLTGGIPTPEQIAQQKAGYASALDKQLKEAIDTVQKETQIEKEMIKFNADKTIALYNMQVEEKLTEALALADEQATFALCELNKAKVERTLQLSNQANGLVLDYQMKAVQSELAQKQYEFQMTYMKAENKLQEEYNKQVAAAQTGTSYTVPAAAVAAKK